MPSPRVSHDVMALAATTTPTPATTAIVVKNRRTRALLRLSPAMISPATSPISAVLVCESSTSTIREADSDSGGPPARPGGPSRVR